MIKKVVMFFFMIVGGFACLADDQSISIQDLMAIDPQVHYCSCVDIAPFLFKPLPVTQDHYLHPYQGHFKSNFIVTIPNGQAFGRYGWIRSHEKFVTDFIWRLEGPSAYNFRHAEQGNHIIKHGKVAVIAQAGCTYYYHWIVEVLGRLALLEMYGVEYDYLYVSTYAPYMKETLELWGIDTKKIIDAADGVLVQADELIIPSLVSDIFVNGYPRLAHYIPDYILFYIRDKLLLGALSQPYNGEHGKKIFISRKDAQIRKILNEDEIFESLRAHGFQSYQLSHLTIAQQIQLFYNAEIIVSASGSGLTNILFCQPTVRVVEMFLRRRDGTIYYVSQMLGINYDCLQTMDFIDAGDGQYDVILPMEAIDNLFKII